jgi:hypothetical protein
MSLISIWNNTCLKAHQSYSRSQLELDLLPSRVVDVSCPGTPVLSATAGQKCRYMTLSYTWGQSNCFTATSASSRSVTYRQAMILCLIFEMTYALAVGARRRRLHCVDHQEQYVTNTKAMYETFW